jgi:hypothetical protein
MILHLIYISYLFQPFITIIYHLYKKLKIKGTMYCTILKKTHIFVLSIGKVIYTNQISGSPPTTFMKKLLLLLAITLISLSSMAMGFPNNSYSQQKALYKNSNRVAFKTPLQTIEVGFTNTLEQLKNNEESTRKSLVEMVVNYVVILFAEKVFEQKASVGIKNFDKCQLESVAIKKDFEYHLIG